MSCVPAHRCKAIVKQPSQSNSRDGKVAVERRAKRFMRRVYSMRMNFSVVPIKSGVKFVFFDGATLANFPF